MTTFRILTSAILAALLTATPSLADQPKHPNVLFIAVDDLRCDLGCYGHPVVNSPNIDRLAARGTTFMRAYCQQAVCNPSRSSLLTSHRPDFLRIWDLKTHFRDNHPNIMTLPLWFKQHGYYTQGIGKIFHNWHTTPKGDPMSWSTPAVMHFATHGSDKPQVDGKLPPNLCKTRRCECRDVPDDAYFDGRIANLAVQALRRLKDKRFFLAVGFWKPHLPFNAPKRYWDLYKRSRINLPTNPNAPDGVPKIALHDSRELLGRNGRKLSKNNVLELRHGYYAAISYLDAQIGKVLDELRRLQLDDNTIVVFWSDHGYHLGEHSLWCKTSNFEFDARVPLIIAPLQPKHPGNKTQALAELLDLFPTLTDLCTLPTPKGLAGVTLKPVLQNPSASVRQAAFSQHPRPAYYRKTPQAMGYSVRTDRYRYTEWRDWKTGKIVARELYDHNIDPRETRNLVANPPDKDRFQQAVRLLRKQFPSKAAKPK